MLFTDVFLFSLFFFLIVLEDFYLLSETVLAMPLQSKGGRGLCNIDEGSGER